MGISVPSSRPSATVKFMVKILPLPLTGSVGSMEPRRTLPGMLWKSRMFMPPRSLMAFIISPSSTLLSVSFSASYCTQMFMPFASYSPLMVRSTLTWLPAAT